MGTRYGRAHLRRQLPHINNWDIAVFKNFPLYERVRLQFRSEFCNAFNHTQFNAWDTTCG